MKHVMLARAVWPFFGSVRARATALGRRDLVGYRAASHGGADEDAVLGMRIGSCDRATRAHRPGLSPVPLPGLWQAVQRTAPISPSTSHRLIGPFQRFVAPASSFDHLVGTGEEPVRNREAECMHRSMEGSINHSNLQQPGGILMEPPGLTGYPKARELMERIVKTKINLPSMI